MGTELFINGEPTEYEDDRTISEVKQDASFPADELVEPAEYTAHIYESGSRTAEVIDGLVEKVQVL